MVILRRTRKLSSALPASTSDESTVSDAALGDWYVNRLVVNRQPLLLLVSSASLLALLVPAREVRSLPDRLAGLVGDRLRRLGVAADMIDAEMRAMSPVAVGSTVDRSVVGILVDFAKLIPFYLGAGRWDERALLATEDRLAATPCHASRSFDQTVFPDRRASELLCAKWTGPQRTSPENSST